MNDVYVEWLVKKERSMSDNGVRIVSMAATIVFAALFCFTGNVLLMLVAVALGGFTYFAFHYTDVEYEYIYVSGELSIDRILSKSKRKRVENFEISRMEIVAPLGSYKLDGFKNKKYREYDYTSGVKSPDSHIFVLYYSDGRRILFEPNREMMEALRSAIPHKVHIDFNN